MGLQCARRGEWYRHPSLAARCGIALLLALIVGCGGGSDSTTDSAPSEPAAPAGVVRPGELPEVLLLGEPRNEDDTSNIALAWSSEGAFTGSILARIEAGLGFTPLDQFTLQHNGAPVVYEAAGDDGSVPFELRYADGFFLLTAQVDNPSGLQGLYGVDIYPTGVPPVPPAGIPPCTGNDTEVCSNSMGFIENARWPRVAGDWRSLLVPRADPAKLTYDVLFKLNEGAEFLFWTAFEPQPVRRQGARLPRGTPAVWDFPTARVKVRGCNAAGECVESAERSLESALLRGIVPIDANGAAPNGQVARNNWGDRMAVLHEASPGAAPFVRILQRDPLNGPWRNLAQVRNSAPGFGRSIVFSGDGLTLAVEASPCPVSTVVCSGSTVFVYTGDAGGSIWTERARFDGVRSPKLDRNGTRLVGIGVGPRANTIAAFELRASWQPVPFPELGYTPLDIALAIDGPTLAVARQGTLADPCGCRAVVVYDRVPGESPGWRQVAVLRSKKRLDTVGSPHDDGFGYAGGTTQSVAVNPFGSFVAVGASLDSSDASDLVGDPHNHNAPHSGAIYVFERGNDNAFAQQAFVKAVGAAAHDHFGHTVSIPGGILLGGARGLAGDAPGINRVHAADPALPSPTPGPGGSLTGGAVYEFGIVSNGWLATAKLIAPNADRADFGTYHSFSFGMDGTVALTTGVRDASGAVTRRVFMY